MNQDNTKEEALMLLGVAVYNEVITDDQAIAVMLSMDRTAHGTPTELELRAKAISSTIYSLKVRYMKERQI